MRFTPTILASLALVSMSTTDAFAPASSFVHRSTAVTTYERTLYAPISSHVQTYKTKTALQMNLVDRFMRVAKSNINSVLMNLEGPEKIMNQAVEDMQKDLLKIRQSYAEITASQRRLIKKKEAAEASAQDWYNRAQLALRNDNEGLAKAALSRRQEQLEAVQGLMAQIEVQDSAIDKLYQGMHTLEAKILEAKQKKEQYIARAKTAESTAKVNDMLSGVTGKTSMDAFNRMEEKVEALEAAAEASVEMSSIDGTYLPGSTESDLEREFRLLEGTASVDEELSRMKSKLLTGSKSDVDPELERMRNSVRRTSKKMMLD